MLVSGTGWEQGPPGPCCPPAPATLQPYRVFPSRETPRPHPCAPGSSPVPLCSPQPVSLVPASPRRPLHQRKRTRPRTLAPALTLHQFCVSKRSDCRRRLREPRHPEPRGRATRSTRSRHELTSACTSNGAQMVTSTEADVFVKRRPPVCGLRQAGTPDLPVSDFGAETRHKEGSPGPGATGLCRPDFHLHAPRLQGPPRILRERVLAPRLRRDDQARAGAPARGERCIQLRRGGPGHQHRSCAPACGLQRPARPPRHPKSRARPGHTQYGSSPPNPNQRSQPPSTCIRGSGGQRQVTEERVFLLL